VQHFHGLSDPQCEALVLDRLSWRKFVGLALTESVPDETTLVRFRQRLIEHGLHQKLLALVNEQLSAQGLIVREVTLVDATLVPVRGHMRLVAVVRLARSDGVIRVGVTAPGRALGRR
jgi:IS5 family transposase